eukprot:Skav218695  [mRNA]  locus=scaffold1346:179487:179804:- [translate_table: standard]
MSEVEVLCVILALMRSKCSKLSEPQQDVMRLLLAAIQRRVAMLGGTPANLQTFWSMLFPLKKFTVGRLFDILQQCQQVDATLKSEVQALLGSARVAMHDLTSQEK